MPSRIAEPARYATLRAAGGTVEAESAGWEKNAHPNISPISAPKLMAMASFALCLLIVIVVDNSLIFFSVSPNRNQNALGGGNRIVTDLEVTLGRLDRAISRNQRGADEDLLVKLADGQILRCYLIFVKEIKETEEIKSRKKSWSSITVQSRNEKPEVAGQGGQPPARAEKPKKRGVREPFCGTTRVNSESGRRWPKK